MESKHNISHTARHDSASFQNQVFENTNPFQGPSRSIAVPSQSAAKPGKRPRIMRPIYSARLS
ncbi:hypothetical protein ACFP1I_30465 [Dyadobacter subterraneus]|uniref:Uncharacterized protein n=1 Tax=Dyadobacter subterraneus TaxID=2773304 RepID=A0ABR9W9N7_9BACT|nr:hypothetical protein [Dyadobacter subterraneus]MBE9461641.1 hypothetical protein [Dyadobacter subterraneus]